MKPRLCVRVCCDAIVVEPTTRKTKVSVLSVSCDYGAHFLALKLPANNELQELSKRSAAEIGRCLLSPAVGAIF